MAVNVAMGDMVVYTEAARGPVPAVVTELVGDDGRVHLTAFYPSHVQALEAVPYAAEPTDGHWSPREDS